MSTTQSNNTYDAIVVGTGISGGWAAKELSLGYGTWRQNASAYFSEISKAIPLGI